VSAVLGATPYTREQMEEDLLYFDLSIARSLRRKVERLSTWCDEFLFAKIERDAAIESARERMVRLRALRHPIPGDIAEMILVEGA
jgi:hypothetical protein